MRRYCNLVTKNAEAAPGALALAGSAQMPFTDAHKTLKQDSKTPLRMIPLSSLQTRLMATVGIAIAQLPIT